MRIILRCTAMSSRLQNRSAIVTGAGRGIGRAIALAFAREGARVVVNDVDPANAESVVKEIVGSGGEAVTNNAGIGTVEAAESVLATALDSFGEVDILVN